MSDHRSAAREVEVQFPDRDEHALAFDELLAAAYGQQLAHDGEPVVLLYIGATSPGRFRHFMPSVALASPAHLPVCLVKMAQVARNAGQLPDAAIKQMVADLTEMMDS